MNANEDRVALVTGSTSGIGEAIARRLADEGLRVILNSSRSAEAGRKLAAELPRAHYIQADISDEHQARRLADEAVAAFGRLDILVNNAGATYRIPHHDLTAVTPAIWHQVLGVNVVGTWQVTVAAVPHLAANGGSVVNVSSVAGTRPAGSSIPYAVSKAGIEHLTRLLANVLGPAIRVNAVAPGLIDTGWSKGFPDYQAIADHVSEAAPLRRVGLPRDVADTVLALLGSEYTTGAIVSVDGGAHLI